MSYVQAVQNPFDSENTVERILYEYIKTLGVIQTVTPFHKIGGIAYTDAKTVYIGYVDASKELLTNQMQIQFFNSAGVKHFTYFAALWALGTPASFQENIQTPIKILYGYNAINTDYNSFTGWIIKLA